jgi:hypothetical protein
MFSISLESQTLSQVLLLGFSDEENKVQQCYPMTCPKSHVT